MTKNTNLIESRNATRDRAAELRGRTEAMREEMRKRFAARRSEMAKRRAEIRERLLEGRGLGSSLTSTTDGRLAASYTPSVAPSASFTTTAFVPLARNQHGVSAEMSIAENVGSKGGSSVGQGAAASVESKSAALPRSASASSSSSSSSSASATSPGPPSPPSPPSASPPISPSLSSPLSQTAVEQPSLRPGTPPPVPPTFVSPDSETPTAEASESLPPIGQADDAQHESFFAAETVSTIGEAAEPAWLDPVDEDATLIDVLADEILDHIEGEEIELSAVERKRFEAWIKDQAEKESDELVEAALQKVLDSDAVPAFARARLAQAVENVASPRLATAVNKIFSDPRIRHVVSGPHAGRVWSALQRVVKVVNR